MTQSSFSDKFVHATVDRADDRSPVAASASDPTDWQALADTTTEHFDVLLGAVTARLALAAAAVSNDASGPPTGETTEAALQRLRMTVSECVEALQQLQATQRNTRR